MLFADLIPAVAGRTFHSLDRLSGGELVTAIEPVPGREDLWIVRTPRGGLCVCRRADLSDIPPAALFRRLRDEVENRP